MTKPAADLRRFERILDSASDAFIGMDAAGLITEWNRQAAKLFGWSRDDVVGRSVADVVVPPDLREAHSRGVVRFLTTRQPRVLGKAVETRGFCKDGTELPIELTRWVLDEDDDEPTFYAFIRDITARKDAEFRLSHDALTGLANRTLLMTKMERVLAEPDASPALLFIDLDRFKRVNDDLGHAAGDDLLRLVADRLGEAVGPSDVVARLAGDEFALLLVRASQAQATAAAQRVISAIATPLGPPGHQVPVSASVGIAMVSPGRGCEPLELLREADAAMYSAKRAGRGRYAIYDDDLRRHVALRKGCESELEAALERDEFEVYYQPIFDAATRTLRAAEALLRWHHPQHGTLAPGGFIEVAEDSGLIIPMGEWVLRAAARQAAQWSAAVDDEAHDREFWVSVNLSARQIADPHLVAQARSAFADADLLRPDGPGARSRVSLELTESALVDNPEAAAETMWQLRELGAAIVIDDFGTGYSSLSYLKTFPADIVKIDKSFVDGLIGSRADQAIVRAVIALGAEMGFDVVAEGVETEQQLSILADLGCDYIQGFLLGRPAPAADLSVR